MQGFGLGPKLRVKIKNCRFFQIFHIKKNPHEDLEGQVKGAVTWLQYPLFFVNYKKIFKKNFIKQLFFQPHPPTPLPRDRGREANRKRIHRGWIELV